MLYLENMGMNKRIYGVVVALFLQACSVGLDGGSIEKSFTGIQQATVMGPETVGL